jgi:hypothetical protein
MLWTTISVTKKLRDELKKIRITRRETYDEIIQRLLLFHKKYEE